MPCQLITQKNLVARSFFIACNTYLTIHFCSQLLDMIRSNIFIIFHHLINNTVRSQFDDTVGNRLDKLMVM